MIAPLAEWRVLVPRGGSWGNGVATEIEAQGGEPVVSPLIAVVDALDLRPLSVAFAAATDGAFDWILVTSASTVEVLCRHRVILAAGTRVAAVGEATAAALHAAGYRVDMVPVAEQSARGLLTGFPTDLLGIRILMPHGDLARPDLANGLRARGAVVTDIIAYRTVSVRAPLTVASDVAAGRIGALLVSSGSIAREIAAQFAPLPERALIVCIGPHSAADARAVGLRVDAVATRPSGPGLVEALVAQVTQ